MNKTIRRIIGALLIISALIVTQIPAADVNASVANADFLRDNDTLSKYSGTATAVSVPDDIKVIGEEAFAGNQMIAGVKLGKNTKIIEHGAFANCSYLYNVSIGDNVETINSAAFSACSNLEKINLGKRVNEIGEGVFAGCSRLATVNIDRENENFKVINGVLYDTDKSDVYAYFSGNTNTAYAMPNTVERIHTYSFWGNDSLEEVVLSDKLDEIAGYAFSNCRNLRYVTIPYSVNSIDAKAFENCISLRDLEIPPSVTYIDPTAFDGCVNLNIIANEGTAAYEFFQNFDRSDIGLALSQDAKYLVHSIEDIKPGETNINDTTNDSGLVVNGYRNAATDPSNVDWMPSVSSLNAPEDSSVLGKTIVVSGRALFFINKELEVNELTNSKVDNNGVVDNSNESVDNEETGTVIYDSGKGGYLPKYTEVNGKIATQAYYGADDIEDFSFPNNISEIGRFSFARSNISEANIPNGVTTIDYGAFYHCDNLQEVNIPTSVKRIDGYAFENTPFLNDYKSNVSSSDFLIVGDGVLLAANSKSANVDIPNGVKSISDGCFMNNNSITSVNIPSSVEYIGSDVFRGCNSLNTVNMSEGITHIGDRAFMGCPLSSLVIPASVKEIGLRAVDFTGTTKTDSTKVVIFKGNDIPKVCYDETSSRLNNSDYRVDSLYNVLFVIVNNDVDSFENTVLDDSGLGFSGVVLGATVNDDGSVTGDLNVKGSYIFSEEVLNSLPEYIAIRGNNYSIKDIKDVIITREKVNDTKNASKDLSVVYNGVASKDILAQISQNEMLGNLEIKDSSEAENTIREAYSELFGGDTVDVKGYDISLYDAENTVKIDRLGQADVAISMPYKSSTTGIVHVVTIDEDGQLEECKATVNDGSITFYTNHFSFFGIYTKVNDNVTLNIKNGRLVKNLKLDESPDTGDYHLPIKYVVAIFLLASGLLIILLNNKKKLV